MQKPGMGKFELAVVLTELLKKRTIQLFETSLDFGF